MAPYMEKKVFEYTLDDDGNATITKYDGNVRALTIPDTLDGYTVVAIGSSAFAKNTYLQSVVIPDTVTVIQESAFAECTNLSGVALSEGLVDLGCNAFGETALTSIVIPKSLEIAHTYWDSLGRTDGPFQKCNQLRRILFETGTKKVAQFLFAGCTGLEKVVIPDEITAIGKGAFQLCSNLTSVTLPETCTEIGAGAFMQCEKIEKIEIPNNVITIGSEAFKQCSELQQVILSSKLKDLGTAAFAETAITEIEIPKSLETAHTYWDNLGRTDGPFEKCDRLRSVSFETGTKQVAQFLFAGCTGLEKIVIPDEITTIGKGALQLCKNLTNVTLPESVYRDW